MSKITLYSKEHCPMCKQLEKELTKHSISFEKDTDVNKMIAMGIKNVPMLSIDGRLMGLAEAMKYLKDQGDN